MANPYTPPTAPSQTSGAASVAGQGRGGCLTAFLILAMIANPLTAISYLFMGDQIRRQLPDAPPAIIAILGIACLANFVFALGVWRWKRWGVYGFLATSALAFVINLVSGLGGIQIGIGLIGPILLVLLVRPLWPRFS